MEHRPTGISIEWFELFKTKKWLSDGLVERLSNPLSIVCVAQNLRTSLCVIFFLWEHGEYHLFHRYPPIADTLNIL